MACGFPETYFPSLRPASNSGMADTYRHDFVDSGDDRDTIHFQSHGWYAYYVSDTSYAEGYEDAIVPTFKSLTVCGFFYGCR